MLDYLFFKEKEKEEKERERGYAKLIPLWYPFLRRFLYHSRPYRNKIFASRKDILWDHRFLAKPEA